MSFRRNSAVLAASAAVLAAVALTPATAFAAGPPAAATAYHSAVITPDGGSVTGFGITATFAPGAVTTDRLIVLGNWPNGLDVTPPMGTAVKTFGIQECNVDFSGCTSVFGNYPNSPAGNEKIQGQVVPYSAFQPLGTTPNAYGNTTFGTATNKLVTITTNTTADRVYVYNANNSTTATAYPKLLPSTSDGSTLTFKTFQPIVWTLTAPSN
jgi:hypothetical protein